MTDTPIVPPNNPGSEFHSELRAELRNWCEAWKTCLQNVLSQVSGQPIVFEISSEPLATADADVWYTVVAGGAVHGEMTLRLPAASGARLARKFLGETEPAAGAVTPEGITAEQKEALEELLRQIAGLAATALAPSVGGEVQLHLSASTAPSWSSDAVICLQTRDEAGTIISVGIQISPALAAELQPRVQPKTQPASVPQTSAASSTPASTLSPPLASYGRLMDVGLDVKLRFGTRRMLLRDVLAIKIGRAHV
jgi:flagellar motor switch/type III secretory pathway protein FliN